MSAAFARSIRSLGTERFFGSYLGLALAAILVAAWMSWFTLSTVPVYQASTEARLEGQSSAWRLQSPIEGQVAAAWLQIGKRVQEGDVLLEFSVEDQQLELEELRSGLESSVQQMEMAHQEILGHKQALSDLKTIGPTALDEARARQREAESQASLAQEQMLRVRELVEKGDATLFERRQAEAQAEQRSAAADAARLAVERLQLEQQSAATERRLQIEELGREVAKLEGQRRTHEASIERLEHQIARRRVLAPVAGVLGEAADIRQGSVLAEREWLGTIIPESAEFRVVAEFPAWSAMGRIAANQRARVRLHGFPWSQYGTLAAVVDRVAGEVRSTDRTPEQPVVRVELRLEPLPNGTAITLQHGLPGTVEVEVERLSPAMLVLRTVGNRAAPARMSRLQGFNFAAHGPDRRDRDGSTW